MEFHEPTQPEQQPAVDPPPQYAPPPQQQPVPSPGYAPQPQPGAGYPSYGYFPQDGNTSGMGEGYPVPPSVKGWTFAGFIPYGIFAFANGNAMWGAFGLLAHFLGLGLVYCIVLGVMGREVAWKSRRFASLAEFEETMAAWNKWGIFILLAQIGLVVLVVAAYAVMFASIFTMMMREMY